jgi:hypothetical protein
MENLSRITFDPQVMGAKPCIRGMRLTVGTIVGLIASGKTVDQVLADYPLFGARGYPGGTVIRGLEGRRTGSADNFAMNLKV